MTQLAQMVNKSIKQVERCLARWRLNLVPSNLQYQAGPTPIYQARESSPVSAENVIYEAFVVMVNLGVVSLQCFHREKKKCIQVNPYNLLYTFPFLQERNKEKPSPFFSSLVNKQVVPTQSSLQYDFPLPGRSLGCTWAGAWQSSLEGQPGLAI